MLELLFIAGGLYLVWKIFGRRRSVHFEPYSFDPIKLFPTESAHRKTIQKLSAADKHNPHALNQLPTIRVTFIKDGDTFDGRYGRVNLTIRLMGIDCPEDGQPWGDIATFGLVKMIGGTDIKLKHYGMDVYGRTLATVYIWDKNKKVWINVCERMVMLGHAWVAQHFPSTLPKRQQANLKRVEQWAKSKKIGLWADDNAIPPWEWRCKDE
jgi:endonuclease YncB( thermonuclease family)